MPEIRVQLFGPQLEFLRALLDDETEQIGYGGARGGGKSHVLRIGIVIRALQFPGSKHLLMRRTHADVVDQHEQPIKDLLTEWGIPYKYNQTKKVFFVYQPGCATSEIRLGFAEYVKHAEKYAGIEFLTLAYDEGTHFEQLIYDRIGGSARVSVDHPGARIKKIVTCNPGGVGHQWIKARFVRPDTRDANTRWIPARLTDNVVLMDRDPTYAQRLTRGLPEWLKRQWLLGDWDATEGSYFSLSPNSLRRVEPPSWAKWYAGVDWGFYPSAFAYVVLAVWQDPWTAAPRAHVYKVLKQQKLNYKEQAEASLDLDKLLPVTRPAVRWADPSTKRGEESENKDQGQSVRHAWAKYGFHTVPAKRHGRVAGWQFLREMLAPVEGHSSYGSPGYEHGVLTIDPSCLSLIHEINDAQYETSQGVISGDDLAGEDHCLDSLRYCLHQIYHLRFPAAAISAYMKRPNLLVPPLPRVAR